MDVSHFQTHYLANLIIHYQPFQSGNPKAHYSGPLPLRPTLGNGKSGLIRGVASREGSFRYNYTEFVL